MLKKILVLLIGCIIGIGISLLISRIYKNNLPEQGMVLRYEDFRGYKVPIKADGIGGEYRWIADVPWKMFTIEEKFDMARVHGGWLSNEDIAAIKSKYGAR